jgi:hypothetical protein
MFYTHPPPSGSPDRIEHHPFLACQLGASSVCPDTWLIEVREFSISFYMSASRLASQQDIRILKVAASQQTSRYGAGVPKSLYWVAYEVNARGIRV